MMADLQQQAPESRSAEFSSGQSGDGIGTTIASALPRVAAQANPKFDGSSTLMVPNEIAPVNGESDSTYMTKAFPAMAKSSPMTAAQKGQQ